MFTTAQTRTAEFANISEAKGGVLPLEQDMLLLVILGLVAVAMSVITSRVSKGVSSTKLGWMSDQWLAEYRASHVS